MEYGWPALLAVLLWWSTTAAAIHLNGLPRATFPLTFAGSTALMIGSLVLMHAGSGETSVSSAYISFTCGLLYWAWQDVGFYLGYVTGWRKQRCEDGCSGWRHFVHAIEASIYHELCILAAAAAAFALISGSPNEVGLWTFCILWWMHQSAKLNVFLGVTNLNTDFLPAHLRFLEPYFRKRSMNLLFPISITALTLGTVWLGWQAAQAPTGSFDATAYTLLATLMLLGLLEHWFLVLPLPFERLWKWAIVPATAAAPCEIDVVVGNLGAGKTTYLRSALEQAGGRRTVVLVNDFGALGIDASLLSNRGAEVVELPNGCICCTLRNDLASEVARVLGQWRPERLLIEPSGVADIRALLGVLMRPDLLPPESSIHVTSLIDASTFTADYAHATQRIEAIVRLADTVVINKADLVERSMLDIVTETIHAIAPTADAFIAVRGAPVGGAPRTVGPHAASGKISRSAAVAHEPHDHHSGEHPLTAWSAPLADRCGVDELSSLLSRIVLGRYGQIKRLKGIAQTNAGWVSFDIAGGRTSMLAFAPRDKERARVMAIGADVDEIGLAKAFSNCGIKGEPAAMPA